jgi:peptide/nickel transport system permease protein
MITFAIFFLIPRLAAQNMYQLAAVRRRTPTRQAILQVERQLSLADPLYLQYGRFLKGIVLGAHYRTGPTVTWTAVAVSDSGADDVERATGIEPA